MVLKYFEQKNTSYTVSLILGCVRIGQEKRSSGLDYISYAYYLVSLPYSSSITFESNFKQEYSIIYLIYNFYSSYRLATLQICRVFWTSTQWFHLRSHFPCRRTLKLKRYWNIHQKSRVTIHPQCTTPLCNSPTCNVHEMQNVRVETSIHGSSPFTSECITELNSNPTRPHHIKHF